MKIFCLGNFQILDDSNNRINLSNTKSKKSRSLLRFFVANRGKWISSSALCEMYWSGMDEEYAKMNLQCTVHMIRRMLGNRFILYRDDGYIFDPEGKVEIDAEKFDKAVKEAVKISDPNLKKQLLQSAIEMYKGDYMQEDLYEDWVLRYREYYKDIFVTALIELSRIYLEERNPIEALALSKRALAEDVFNEQACSLTMMAYSAIGNSAEAVLMFHNFTARLKKELQVEPSKELLNTYQSIISGSTEKRAIIIEEFARESDTKEVLNKLRDIIRSSDKIEKLSASKVAIWLDGMSEKDAEKLLERVQNAFSNWSSQLKIYMRKAR